MTARLAMIAALACAIGCGDNVLEAGFPVPPADRVAIVAHVDDDLIFLSQDLSDALAAGESLTVIYVTAGQARHGVPYAEDRQRGARAAYAAITGLRGIASANGSDVDSWSCGWIEVRAVPVEHCRLDHAPVSLVFVNVPDGGKEGERSDSLLRLWQGERDTVTTMSRQPTAVDRDTLIELLADLVAQSGADIVHTLDFPSNHGRDHVDHLIVGAAGLLATTRAGHAGAIVAHHGYNVLERPENRTPEAVARAEDALGRYNACISDCGRCYQDSCPVSPAHALWLRRRYATTRVVPPVDGVLELAACDGPGCARWRLAADGTVRDPDDRCLTVDVSGEGYQVTASPCHGGVEQVFVLDDEGTLWSGLPPRPEAEMSYRSSICVGPNAEASDASDASDGISAGLCGRDRGTRWMLVDAPD